MCETFIAPGIPTSHLFALEQDDLTTKWYFMQ